jgi:hypothetical protein
MLFKDKQETSFKKIIWEKKLTEISPSYGPCYWKQDEGQQDEGRSSLPVLDTLLKSKLSLKQQGRDKGREDYIFSFLYHSKP